MMTEPVDPGKYEFNPSENRVLLTLSRDLHRLGLFILLTGVLFIIYLVVAYLDPAALMDLSEAKTAMMNAIDYGLWIIIALLVIYLSIMVVRLARPVRRIAETSGADMVNLMKFLMDLTRLVRICFNTLMVVCILMLGSFLLLIVVF
jgi:hypothetical protein